MKVNCIPLIPPLYGVGTGVASPSSPQIPPAICYPSQPQQPPQQQSLPNPPSSQAYVETRYYLNFPLLVGANVRVIWNTSMGTYTFPSTNPIALHWQYYPDMLSRPRVFATTTNPFIDTYLKSYIDNRGWVIVDPDPPIIDSGVMQLWYHNQRWLVACYQVSFPNAPLLSAGATTPDDLRFILQNREERLTAFYDTEFMGFGSFTCHFTVFALTMHLAPTEVYIQPADNPSFLNIYIRPSDNNAYCMLIDPIRGGYRR